MEGQGEKKKEVAEEVTQAAPHQDEAKEAGTEQQEKQEGQAEKPTFTEQDIKENKLVAAIGYLGILFVIPMFVKKDSPYAQFHGKQGMGLFIVSTVLSFIFGFFGIFAIIPFIGWLIFIFGALIFGLVFLVLFVFMIIGIYKAATGKAYELPLVSDLLKWFNL